MGYSVKAFFDVKIAYSSEQAMYNVTSVYRHIITLSLGTLVWA